VIENLGVFSYSSHELISNLGKNISEVSGEAGDNSFLFQRCSVLVQHFNAVLFTRATLC